MTDLSRGARVRRGGRGPGWVLLTALLVLAIGASSALVFTNKVELLKLAVILALWAAVVAAFVSVIYRRQSDMDQARARDLKLVYDLQLDREISARREYELTVESQLRRELATELRTQASDEVSELRAELAALRTNLEILFDAELSHRPALEGERRTVRGYSEWERDSESARERINRVQSVRAEEPSRRPDDSIIDVHEEPLVPTQLRQPSTERYQPDYAPQPHEAYPPPRRTRAGEAPEPDRGSHRRYSDQETPAARHEPVLDAGWTPPQAPAPPPNPVERLQEARSWAPPAATGPERVESSPGRSQRRAEPPTTEAQFAPPVPPPQPEPLQQPPVTWSPAAEAPRQPEQPAGWQPASSGGQWPSVGTSGSNRNTGQFQFPPPTPWAYDDGPSRDQPVAQPHRERRGRHSSADAEPTPSNSEAGRLAESRHSAGYSETGIAGSAPAPAMFPPPPPTPPSPSPTPDEAPAMSPPPPASARHRSTDPLSEAEEPQSGVQSVADLLARLQSSPSEGGGRRRRRGD